MNRAYILIIAIAIIFAGCSKKSGPTPVTPTPSITIIGKWNINADTAWFYTSGQVTQTHVFSEIFSPYMQFNKDGSGVLMDSETSDTLTTPFAYKLTEKNLTLNFPAQVIYGDTTSADTATAAVKQLTATSLVIFYDDTIAGGGYTEAVYMTK